MTTTIDHSSLSTLPEFMHGISSLSTKITNPFDEIDEKMRTSYFDEKTKTLFALPKMQTLIHSVSERIEFNSQYNQLFVLKDVPSIRFNKYGISDLGITNIKVHIDSSGEVELNGFHCQAHLNNHSFSSKDLDILRFINSTPKSFKLTEDGSVIPYVQYKPFEISLTTTCRIDSDSKAPTFTCVVSYDIVKHNLDIDSCEKIIFSAYNYSMSTGDEIISDYYYRHVSAEQKYKVPIELKWNCVRPTKELGIKFSKPVKAVYFRISNNTIIPTVYTIPLNRSSEDDSFWNLELKTEIFPTQIQITSFIIELVDELDESFQILSMYNMLNKSVYDISNTGIKNIRSDDLFHK